MFGLSPAEIAIILIIVIILFGPKRLPELGAGIGKAINNFKESFKEGARSADASSEKLQPTKVDEKSEETK